MEVNDGLLRLAFQQKGQTDILELHALARLASEVELPEVIVEIGTMHGRSALALAAGAYEPRVVYSIEYNPRPPHPPRGIFTEVVGEASTLAQEFKGTVGLLFIDDDHDQAMTERAIRAWLPHLSDNAVFAIHDFNLPQVQGAVRAALPKEFAFDCWVVLTGIFRRKESDARYAPGAWVQTPERSATPIWSR